MFQILGELLHFLLVFPPLLHLSPLSFLRVCSRFFSLALIISFCLDVWGEMIDGKTERAYSGFFNHQLFCLYFSPSTYSLEVYSFQCKDPGDLGSFWPNWAWLTDTFLKWSIGPVSNILEEAWAIVSHNYSFTFPGMPLKASDINNICHQKLFCLQFLWLHSACSWQRKSFSS